MTGSGYRDQVAKYIGYTGGYYGLLAKDKSRRKILLFGHTLLVVTKPYTRKSQFRLKAPIGGNSLFR